MKCDGNECKSSAKYSIVFDCGDSKEQELTLCKKHYDSSPVFQRHILTIKEMKE